MKRSEIQREQERVRAILSRAGLILAQGAEVEIADFGLGDYGRTGLGIVVRVNEQEYCSKYLTLLPGQACPWHFHAKKKETFFVLDGEVDLFLGSEANHLVLPPGSSYTITPGTDHTFSSRNGAVIEEVSTHDENADSYFRDPAIVRDPVIEED